MTLSKDKATIGRQVWFWHSNTDSAKSIFQAFAATVIFVHENGNIDVDYINHFGTHCSYTEVELHDPIEGNYHGASTTPHATWMPYQKKKHEEEKAKNWNNNLAGESQVASFMHPLEVGDIWEYNKEGSKYGTKGDKYRIIGNPLMKIGNGDWIQGVLYCSTDSTYRTFVRDEVKFRESFVKSVY